MADSQLANLIAAVAAADDEFIFQQAAGTRANKIAFAKMGGLVQAAGADAATAMAVGTLYVTDMSAWTASRIYSLPTTAAIGERIGVYITAGNATHEMQLRTTSGSGDTIDGTDRSSSDWSKVYVTGEMVIFECTTANANWSVIHDGRIPNQCIYQGTQSFAASTFVVYDLSALTEQINTGNIGLTASDVIESRRAGVMTIAAGIYTLTGISGNQELILQARRNTGGGIGAYNPLNRVTGGSTGTQFNGITTLTGAYQLDGYQFDVRGSQEGATQNCDIILVAQETLTRG